MINKDLSLPGYIIFANWRREVFVATFICPTVGTLRASSKSGVGGFENVRINLRSSHFRMFSCIALVYSRHMNSFLQNNFK